MIININGEQFRIDKKTVNYADIINASGEFYRKDYTMTVSHQNILPFIVHPGTPDFELLENMRFTFTLTGNA